eukprot:3367002-Prymnesium_polylepis.1
MIRLLQPFVDASSVSDEAWVRGYRLFDPPRLPGRESWSAAAVLHEVSRLAAIARQAETEHTSLVKSLRTWMLTYALSDYCLEGDEPGAPAPFNPEDGSVECGELRLEAMLQIGRLVPSPGALCCAVREAVTFLRVGTPALREERRALWRGLVNDIDGAQCGGLAMSSAECPALALVRDLRHKLHLALKDASPNEHLHFLSTTNATSPCATVDNAPLPANPDRPEVPLVCAYGVRACAGCSRVDASSTHLHDLRLREIGSIASKKERDAESVPQRGDASLDMFHNLQPTRTLTEDGDRTFGA